jgi:tRNA threonylcarbamoyl adenosine modification protein YeaZ
MKKNYLAINTAGKTEILLHINGEYFYHSSPEKTMASVELLPKIDEMLTLAKADINDIDVFACVIGPGSFTGLRIGVSTVRALAFSLKKPVIAVTYFDCLAYNHTRPFSVIIDGSGGVCYLKNYDNKHNDPVCIRNYDIEKYAKHKTIIAYSRFDKVLENCILPKNDESGLKFAVENAIISNELLDYSKLIPLYLRRSQPERSEGEV